MLAEGHFHARSRFAYLNELTPAVPADVLLPWGTQKRFLCAALRLEPRHKKFSGGCCKGAGRVGSFKRSLLRCFNHVYLVAGYEWPVW